MSEPTDSAAVKKPEQRKRKGGRRKTDMATKQELRDHLDDCIGWREKTLEQITSGFAHVEGRLDTQDNLLLFVKNSQTIYNTGKRILGLLFSALGFIATIAEALNGLGIVHLHN